MYKKQISFMLVSLILFFLLAVLLLFREELKIDTIVYEAIKPFICAPLTTFFKGVTFLGSAVGILLFTGIFLLLLRDKRYKIFLLLNLMGAVLLNQGLKFLFTRHRPIGIALVQENGYSFPSGHASIALAFYGFLIYLVWTRFQEKKIRYFFLILLGSIIFLIGLSRIYLGVHYFTDVLGGYLITLSYLILFILLVDQKKIFKI